MGILNQDLRYAARMMLKQKGFTVIAVVALALGIGANTAVFSVVNAVLLSSLPYQEPARITLLWGNNPQLQLSMTDFPISYGDFVDLRDQSQSFENLSALYPDSMNLTGVVDPEHLGGASVSANFFQMLGIAPALGRSFLTEEEQPGNEHVVILSQRLWQRRFGADPNLVGKTIQLNGDSHTVIGIMPSQFEFPQRNDLLLSYGFPRQVEVWKPITPAIEELKNRGNHVLIVMGRLNRGITRAQAQAEMNSVYANIAQQHPNVSNESVVLVPLQEQLVGKFRPALFVLFGAVGFVLLIACANVANLMLARSATRQKEMAIRTALGASPLRLIRQLITESVMLSLAGGLAGLVIALWGTDLILTLSPANLPHIGKIGLDGRVLGFTVLVSLLTGVIFGLVPALQSSRPHLNDMLKEGGRSATRARHHTRNLFVVTEVALTFVLLIGAGLMVKSFWRLQQVDPGFDPKNVLTMQIDLPRSKYPEGRQWSEFFHQLTEKVEALPGVKSVGWTWQVPLGGSDAATNFTIEGPSTDSEQAPLAGIRRVDSGYFRTMGTPIQQGREFTEQDKQSTNRPIIINETMARRFWPNESPLGKRINVLRASREIVGIAKDNKYSAIDAEAAPEMYIQSNLWSMNLLVRTDSEPLKLVAAIRSQVESIDKDQPISEIMTLEQRLSTSASTRRFNMLLMAIFAAVALALAVVGIYGVMSYSVTQSTREIGIRMALGANSRNVLLLVAVQGMALAVVGVAVGTAASVVLTRLMAGLLFGVSATDPLTFVVISVLLTAVALAACLVPARHATKVDPMVALRCE